MVFDIFDISIFLFPLSALLRPLAKIVIICYKNQTFLLTNLTIVNNVNIKFCY